MPSWMAWFRLASDEVEIPKQKPVSGSDGGRQDCDGEQSRVSRLVRSGL